MNTALIVIDVQRDFCPGGALEVPDGDQIVLEVNRRMTAADLVVMTMDWHPAGHGSFASSHGRRPYETLEMPYGPQVLWPDHCVTGTSGAELHPDLDVSRAKIILKKGMNPAIDSYSGFFENDHLTPTGLAGALRELGVDTLELCGLATDFCVKYTALDGRGLGFEVRVLESACRGIDLDGSMATAWAEMASAGVHRI